MYIEWSSSALRKIKKIVGSVVLYFRIPLMRVRMRVPDTDFYLMPIRIRLFTLMRIRLQGSNPWKSAQIGSYSIHFALTSADRDRIGIQLINLMRIRIKILNFIYGGFGSWFLFDADADPDPGSQNDADPDPQHCLMDLSYVLTQQSVLAVKRFFEKPI